jgi:hypothetical protein
MSILPIASHKRQLLEQARAALVYLGIVATFAAVSFIVCAIWLLVWWVSFSREISRHPQPSASASRANKARRKTDACLMSALSQ